LLKWPFPASLCRICKEFHAPRATEGFGSLQCFNFRGLKYDDPLLPEAENSMTHPTGMAENIVTHPFCAPAHPLLYLLTSSLGLKELKSLGTTRNTDEGVL